jgi:hypothetical protein
MNFYRLLSHSTAALALGSIGLFFSGCSDKDDASPAVPACLPTIIPAEIGDDDYLQVTYNQLGKATSISDVSYQEYSMNISYDDQGRLLSVGEEGDYDYFLFEYTDGEIKETYYYQDDNGSYTFDRFHIYETDAQGRIISSTEYDVEESGTEKEHTDEYTYDERGNVVKVTSTVWDRDEVSVTHIAYDDKVSPFHTVGFMIDSGGLFNFISLSPNNIVSYQWEENEASADKLSYEYDEMGNPVKLFYEARDLNQEYDAEGNKVGEPEIESETFINNITFSCR